MLTTFARRNPAQALIAVFAVGLVLALSMPVIVTVLLTVLTTFFWMAVQLAVVVVIGLVLVQMFSSDRTRKKVQAQMLNALRGMVRSLGQTVARGVRSAF